MLLNARPYLLGRGYPHKEINHLADVDHEEKDAILDRHGPY